jgi:hypothetical protein
MFDIIPQIGTPIALIAFVVAVVAGVIKKRIDHQKQIIDAARPEERVRQTEIVLNELGIRYDDLTPEQKFILAHKTLDERAARFRAIVWLSLALSIVAATTLIIVAGIQRPIASQLNDKSPILGDALVRTRTPNASSGAKPENGKLVEQSGPASLFSDYIRFQDGGTAYSPFGCPNGSFFAGTAHVGDKSPTEDPSQFAVLGPATIYTSVDTDLPDTDYIRVTSLEINVTRYTTELSPIRLVVQSRPCADDDPGDGEVSFSATLPFRKAVLPLLDPRGNRSKSARLSIWQAKPTTLRIVITAQRPGWYEFQVVMRYRYRKKLYAAVLPGPVKVFFPSQQGYEWLQDSFEGRLSAVPVAQVRQLVQELNANCATGFPPKLPANPPRSGLID